MSESFNSFKVGDEVTVYGGTPGVVSFICEELKTMSVCIGRGCHKAEDTNMVMSEYNLDKVEKGWPDRELAEKSLTPRPCRWYDGDKSKKS